MLEKLYLCTLACDQSSRYKLYLAVLKVKTETKSKLDTLTIDIMVRQN